MYKRQQHVRIIGSPALDDLPTIEPLDDEQWHRLGQPGAVFLMHPIGRHDEAEEAAAAIALDALRAALPGQSILALEPNHDPGRNGIRRAIAAAGLNAVSHLPRPIFVALLKRMARQRPRAAALLVGNSSAALIEAAALGIPAIDVGRRQSGRERPDSVIHAEESADSIARAVAKAATLDLRGIAHPYGDGRAGPRAAAALAELDPTTSALLRKRCVY